MAKFESTLSAALIYVYAINDEAHQGALKIGKATLCEGDINDTAALEKAARLRINQETKTAGVAYQLLYVENAVFTNKGLICTFNDKQVHAVLERSGIKRKEFTALDGKPLEWYCCDLGTIKRAIAAVKAGRDSLQASEISEGQTPVIFRPEQQEAITRTRKRLSKGNQMLWNAKMRFGKTLTALQVVKEEDYIRTLILTHRPVVDEGWFKDYGKIFFDREDFFYGSKNNGETFGSLEKHAEQGDHYIYFASMQDLRGSGLVGGNFDKNAEVFGVDWNMLIIDEAHEGTQTELGQTVISQLRKKETKVLELSGTPYNRFDDFDEEDTYTWDYVMEQQAKAQWDIDHPYELNPYASLPAINVYTYDLAQLMDEFADDEKSFIFREFFRTTEVGDFIHDSDVNNFLNLLCKDDKDSLYPFSNDNFRRIFRHTLWMVPGVRAAKVLSQKLQRHPVFGKFQIVNVAGNGDEDEENDDALNMVKKAMGKDPEQTYTITLSCGRLTTGVSVPPWTAVLMLAGAYSTSAAGYMQTIFRVQTPYMNHGHMKTNCYAFDFAPDRTLRVMAEVAKVSTKTGKGKGDGSDQQKLGELLNYLSVISIEGSRMQTYDVQSMMKHLKRAQIEKVVLGGFEDGALYNEDLLHLSEVELKEFENLKGIIGRTKAMAKTGDIDVNKQGLTNEEREELDNIERKKKKKELTAEEQARREELRKKNAEQAKQRRDAISILRGISIRMPLLIYGAELTDEEEELSIDNFTSLVDEESWKEFMPKDVTKGIFEQFKKYYDADVFREAGKRIRAMARAADKFTIEERIERLSTIFNTFRNPDKETVLTPWRVVNMHMSDCLGGWCFWDEKFEKMLPEPRWVNQGQVTKDVFRPQSHVLEINSKSGLYPLYVAYNIYRSRVDAARKKYGEIGHGFAMSLWDATIEENILVVCKTPMARSITRRTLAGFRQTRVNAQYYPDLIKNISEQPTVVVNTLRDGKHYWKINNNENMKFDAIVGNPPYQIMDGGGNGSSAVPVYQQFVDISKKMCPSHISMIMPAKWYTGGKGLDDFREKMLNDKKITFIADFDDSRELFPTADIAGGICYFAWDYEHSGLCQFVSIKKNMRIDQIRDLSDSNIFIRDIGALKIVEKVKALKEENMASVVFSRNPFGFTSNQEGSLNRFPNSIHLFTSKGWTYVDKSNISSNTSIIGMWKTMMSKTCAEHAGQSDSNGMKRIISRIGVLAPNEICSESYLILSAFDNKEKAENLVKYMKTKFSRFLLSTILLTQNIAKDKFQLIPLQDFSRPWTDADLYKKYKLTDEEIQFIESMIKPME